MDEYDSEQPLNDMFMELRRNFVAVMLGLGMVSAVAQNADQNTLRIKEEGRTEFVPHWYMGVQAGVGYTRGEIKFGDMLSPAGAVYGGYQFTPLWGVRAGISGWQAKGAWVSPRQVYKYNYLQGNIDATLDLGNLFCGYNADRVFNPYLFAGIGLNGGFNNDEAVAVNNAGYRLQYLWTDNKFNVAGRMGIGANIRLTSRLYLNVEVNGNVLSDKFNSKKAGNADWQLNALAGFAVKFGKTSRKIEPVYYEPVPAPVPPVKEEPVVVEKPAPVPVVEKTEITENVFFAIDSSVIREADKGKIDNLADFLNKHEECTVSICGYADRQTGTPKYNLKLSRKRAESVAEALKAKGISSGRIKIDCKGDTEQPFSSQEKNRVSICVAR